MIKVDYNPDILSCLANLSNDEVFTPPVLANEILDMLPEELWSNKDVTFLDPVSKSGVFLREIAKRLIIGLEDEIPDMQTRVNHILKNQLFGITITELTSLLSRRSLYCSKTANGKYSICNNFDSESGNILFDKIQHSWKNGKCYYCGASQEVYDRDDMLETHAYQFIHTNKPEELFNMKFDVIIGNPPYQLSDGGSGTGISAKPLYHKFIQQAKKLNPRYLTMVIPSRWFAGGKGLDEFREEMLNDSRIVSIIDFISSKDCFPGVNIAGGVCYFLWNKNYNGKCEIINIHGSNKSSMTRNINEFPILIRSNTAISIIHKIMDKNYNSISDVMFTRNPFGFVSKERGESEQFNNSVKLISSGGVGYVHRKAILKNQDKIDMYKVTIGKVVPSNGEVDVSPDVGYMVTTKPKIHKPGEIHTETYMLLSVFDNIKHANNFSLFMSQKLPRFLLKQTLSSMNISKSSFSFVPFLDFNNKWTDDDLYKLFDLSDNEIEHIESFIRPMESINE